MVSHASALPVLLVILFAANPLAAEDAATHFAEVASVFSRHCVRCHNDIDQEGDFSLETVESLVGSGFVQPGDPTSHLLSVIQRSGKDLPSMPKDADPLSAEDVEIIRRWIEAGAGWSQDARIEEAVSDFDWWSFRPIKQPAVPASTSDWARTPVDAFVIAKQAEKG
jgi:mono/diheme cytochrome c family protein